MPIDVIYLILTVMKNGFRKVLSDNLLMEGKLSYFTKCAPNLEQNFFC